MKSVLISIRPKWCDLIASGKKTLEVRKTRPKLEVPFKVYIYCTSGTGKNTFNVPVSHEQLVRHYAETGSMECLNCPIGNGKVIGEFICDSVHQYSTADHVDGVDITTEDVTRMSCLTKQELEAYEYSAEPKDFSLYMIGLYCWHISDLKIYEKPKELIDFYNLKKCNSCRKSGYESTACIFDENCRVPATITRPPQSWCYVEEA